MNEPLTVDEEFKSIIPPLTREEYANLEASLRSEGCREAIIAWNGVIVDGHNRYELCRKWNIPYRVMNISFSSREAAVSWICLNQLSRRNLTREAYKYLIGKRYDAEKAACEQRNAPGRNQYSVPSHGVAQWTSRRLAGEYNLTHSTVERYGVYSRSLDRIEEARPGVLPDLLSGRCRISQQNLIALSRMPGETVNRVLDKLLPAGRDVRSLPLKVTGGVISDEEKLDPRIKEMPPPDPDAELNGLLYTVPTWIGMMRRLLGVPARCASGGAKRKMVSALRDLKHAADRLMAELDE